MSKPFRPKSIQVMRSFGFLICLEGAVRSAKTFTSLVKWYHYILNSPENVFLMSGATMGSLSRNCLEGDYGFIAITGKKAKKKTDSDGSKYLKLGDKRIYYCGAENAGSFKKIRGITIGGWYADEVSLHDREFIQTAMARSFTSTDLMNIWTLNPEVPTHFIYTEYLDKYEREKTDGYHWFHFLMQDNPGITEERLARIANQHSGVFYKRYVLGLRVRAEGGCYPSWRSEINVIDKVPEGAKLLYCNIGVDIGGSISATSYTLNGFYIIDQKIKLVVLDEFYDPINKDTESVIRNYKEFVIKCKKQYHQVVDTYIDSAEQLFKKSFTRLGMVNVRNARKGAIKDRIRFLDLQFACERAYVMRRCKNTIIAIETAVWDDKADGEDRLDDGKQNVDSLDSMEYGFEKAMRDFE